MTDDGAADGVEPDNTGTVEPTVATRTPDGRCPRIRRLASPLMLIGVSVVLSVGLAAALYFTEQQFDTQTDDAAARSAVRAASQGAAAVLSYAPESLNSDLAAAKSHLTGEFLDYYSKFSDEILGPTAKEKQITTKAKVVRAAVSELRPDSAKVLVFVNEVSKSKDKPFVAMGNSVIVSLTKSDDTWLISGFESV